MHVFHSLALVLTAGALGAGVWARTHAAGPAPPAPPRPVPPAGRATYANPVIDRNFPDPSILSDRGAFYAYATNTHANMQCASSIDLVHWTALPDAMPGLPDWAKEGRTWAPFVCVLRGNRGCAVYFTACNRATGQQNIGVAVAPRPQGPFQSAPHALPLVEQASLGGAIDPMCFTDDDGSRYLVWKNDGNSRGVDTWLWVQPLSPDGLSLLNTPTRLVKQDQSWEGNLVEAPCLHKHGGRYYLFYSANAYSDCRYAVGYAVANTLRGPYVKFGPGPWLASAPDTCGPGGEDIVRDGSGAEWMAYHTWVHGPHTYRGMSIDALYWDSRGPHLRGPSRSGATAPISSAVPPLLAEIIVHAQAEQMPAAGHVRRKHSPRARGHANAR